MNIQYDILDIAGKILYQSPPIEMLIEFWKPHTMCREGNMIGEVGII